MAYTNFITITDRTSTSPLWDGEEVTILGKDFNINANNIISFKPKTMQTSTLTTADTTAGDSSATGSESYINNFNRRKGNVSYAGFSNQNIKITAFFDENQVSNTTTLMNISTKIFTPSKLYELILKPRTVYIKDQTLIDLLSSAQDGSPAIYNTYGIPVVLRDWSISPSSEGKEVKMELTFTEDKELE